MKATFNGKTIADSDETVIVEDNHYFPPNSIKKDYFKPSADHTICFWKGTASYYNIDVDGKKVANAAWYYPEPSKLAENIKNYVAFYTHLVQVQWQ